MPKDEKVHLCALWLTVPYAPVTYVNGGKSVALPSILCVCVAMPLDFQDLSSPTRDQTQAHGSESTKSQPLDLQGISDTDL